MGRGNEWPEVGRRLRGCAERTSSGVDTVSECHNAVVEQRLSLLKTPSAPSIRPQSRRGCCMARPRRLAPQR